MALLTHHSFILLLAASFPSDHFIHQVVSWSATYDDLDTFDDAARFHTNLPMDDKCEDGGGWGARRNKRKRPAAKTVLRSKSKKAGMANKLTHPGEAPSSASDRSPTQDVASPGEAQGPTSALNSPGGDTRATIPESAQPSLLFLNLPVASTATEPAVVTPVAVSAGAVMANKLTRPGKAPSSASDRSPTQDAISPKDAQGPTSALNSPGDTTVTIPESAQPSLPFLNLPDVSTAAESAVVTPVAAISTGGGAELENFVAQKMREEEEEAQLNKSKEHAQKENPKNVRKPANDPDLGLLNSSTPGISSPESSVASRRKLPSAPQRPAAQIGASQGPPAAQAGAAASDTSSELQGRAHAAPAATSEVSDSNQSSGTTSPAARTSTAREKQPFRSSSSSGDSEKEEAGMWAYAKHAGMNDDDSSSVNYSELANRNAMAKGCPVAMKSATRHWEITSSFQRPPKKPKQRRRGRPKKKKAQHLARLLMERLETSQFKDQRLEVGTTVYAAFPGEKPDKESECCCCRELMLPLMTVVN
jgi:hypothetical protein